MSGTTRRTSAAPRSPPVTRPLSSLLVGEHLSPNTKLEGTVVQVIPYDVSARTSAFAIVLENRRVKIILRGSWSMAAPEYFRTKLNRTVRIIAHGGETVSVVSQQRDRNGDVVMGGNQLGIAFENGIHGYWRNEVTREKEPFAFKSETYGRRSPSGGADGDDRMQRRTDSPVRTSSCRPRLHVACYSPVALSLQHSPNAQIKPQKRQRQPRSPRPPKCTASLAFRSRLRRRTRSLRWCRCLRHRPKPPCAKHSQLDEARRSDSPNHRPTRRAWRSKKPCRRRSGKGAKRGRHGV